MTTANQRNKVINMQIGPTIYSTIVKYAEHGERVTKVILPEELYYDLKFDAEWQHTLRTLGVQVEEGKVREPKFYTEESK